MIFDICLFDTFRRKEHKINNFDTIRWVRYQFKDCIEKNAKESKDIFMPSLGSSNSLDIDDNDRNQNKNKNKNKNKNVIQCQRTAQTKDAQNDKLSRILAKAKRNKVLYISLLIII